MNSKQTWLDIYFGKYKWYRKLSKGTWFKHEFTEHARQLGFESGKVWWARYGELNRYSIIILVEIY
jgi:preprotein translocase subunit SecE